MAGPDISRTQNAVSIITCTKRRQCMDTLFHNYSRQNYRNKELIVILNHNNLKMNEYINAAKSYKNVRIYSLPEHVSLGQCLNYGVKISKYSLIAKFDDDDYYAPGYLTDSVRILLKTNADIAGKRAHYMYLNGKKTLLLRYFNMANKHVPLVQGATLLVKRHVFSKVHFPNRNRGECVKFCSDSRAKGFKIYSGSPHNFYAIRRRNSIDHTWIVSDKSLLTRNVKVLKVKNIRKFVSRG
ncbi:glycosyltransferase family 2 protein [Paenibacillus durus]|uniref:Glycosyl transferase family 2 n=1 Tax=Paenibacillus durus TaxID=44251 RepID=A0A089HL18_PAEDU|nr:glycosyltransferase family A protein [Paenibacillus durus]AIQ11088.1 glycosyl transferase family 2 [Paenibacillus durus]